MTLTAAGYARTRKRAVRKPADRLVTERVGARIRALRVANGMSQEKLGDRLNVSFQQIQKYESGANRVASDRLAAIAEIFKVPMDFFFDTGAMLDGDEPVTSLCGTAVGTRLAKAFIAIDDDTIQLRIVKLVESISTDLAENISRSKRSA